MSAAMLGILGYDDHWRNEFASYAERGFIPARVVRTDRGFVVAGTDEGFVHALLSPELFNRTGTSDELPATGDWVALRPATEKSDALVEAVLPRISALRRADPGSTPEAQVLAANVDTVFLVHPIESEPNLRRLERELTLVWDSGAVPVIVLSKADLATDTEETARLVAEIAPGTEIHVTSAATGEGFDLLFDYLEGNKTVAVIGPSGSGKSTLINRMLGEERQATREVRLRDGKGRHTTVTRELVPLPDQGVLIDTPGLRAVALWAADGGLDRTFADITALAEGCRFRDCTHTNEPGCAVLVAAKNGRLDRERLESYLRLRAEQEAAGREWEARLKEERQRKRRAATRTKRRSRKR
jgi:ribosome biogenesis GTPase